MARDAHDPPAVVSSTNMFGAASAGDFADVMPAPVPVPAALPMILLALGSFGWAARRRRAG